MMAEMLSTLTRVSEQTPEELYADIEHWSDYYEGQLSSQPFQKLLAWKAFSHWPRFFVQTDDIRQYQDGISNNENWQLLSQAFPYSPNVTFVVEHIFHRAEVVIPDPVLKAARRGHVLAWINNFRSTAAWFLVQDVGKQNRSEFFSDMADQLEEQYNLLIDSNL